MIVCKFGGTSVASVSSAVKIKQIVKSNKNRKIVVVSALGKSEGKIKITDLLFKLYYCLINGEPYEFLIDELFLRYKNLSQSLKVNINWNRHKMVLINKINSRNYTKEYIVSRGEYYSAILYSKFLKAKFLDAKNYIKFEKSGKFSEKMTKKCLKTLKNGEFYVIGGFYGGDANGNICVFDRGGSDITGAIICKLLNCEIYENYTDVDGVYDKNPALFSNANKLPLLNYKTAIAMAKGGNEVVHIDALKTMKSSKAILVVKSTLLPQNLGTIVVLNTPSFNNLFICNCPVYVVEFYGGLKLLEHLKQCGKVLKVFKHKNKHIAILCSLYIPLQKLLTNKNIISANQKEMFTVFSNILISKNNLKKLKFLIKKLKKHYIFCKFLSHCNNLVLLLNSSQKSFISSEINKMLNCN